MREGSRPQDPRRAGGSAVAGRLHEQDGDQKGYGGQAARPPGLTAPAKAGPYEPADGAEFSTTQLR
jgi:hypothetical protein